MCRPFSVKKVVLMQIDMQFYLQSCKLCKSFESFQKILFNIALQAFNDYHILIHNWSFSDERTLPKQPTAAKLWNGLVTFNPFSNKVWSKSFYHNRKPSNFIDQQVLSAEDAASNVDKDIVKNVDTLAQESDEYQRPPQRLQYPIKPFRVMRMNKPLFE